MAKTASSWHTFVIVVDQAGYNMATAASRTHLSLRYRIANGWEDLGMAKEAGSTQL